MPDTLSGKRLVFIVGAPRSGTTWLQVLLTTPPETVSAFETHLFSGYLRSNFEKWRSWEESDHVMGLHRLISRTDYFGALRCNASAILLAVTKEKPDAQLIIEKTPVHCAYARDILDLFPDAMFIHLVRDPRSVVASFINASRTSIGTWIPEVDGITTAEACDMWVRSVEASRRIPELTSNYVELRYETLLQNTPQTLKGIFDWLGVQKSENECNEICRVNSFEEMKSSGVFSLPEAFFWSGEAAKWKQTLSRAEVALIQSKAGALMRDLRYPVEKITGIPAWKGSMLGASAFFRKQAKWRLARLGRRFWVY